MHVNIYILPHTSFWKFHCLKHHLHAVYKPYTVNTRVVVHWRPIHGLCKTYRPLSFTSEHGSDARTKIFADCRRGSKYWSA